MGLFDKIKGEFIDVIDWPNSDPNTMIFKYPRYQNEIKNGAKLTVRPGQGALFVNEGNAPADLYQAGSYDLTTQNMPIMTTLNSWKYGFNSPFKADVFFFNLIEFTNMPWGLKNPIIVNDDRFGMIELRGFGTYAFKFHDPKQFYLKFNSADNEFTTDQIKDQLRSLVVMQMSDKLGESAIPVEKLAANMMELSELLLQLLNPVFEKDYGLTLTKFYIENLSMPDEVKKEIMELSRLDKVDLDKLAKMKMAKSLENGGGGGNASDMMGMMMGMNMANQMMNNQNNNKQNTNNNNPPPLVSYFVAVNGQQTGPFDMAALTQQVQNGTFKKESLVWKNGMAAWAQAGTVPELAELFNTLPPPLPPPIG